MGCEKKLRVADFFCGAGGFSEGFRQKGFDVVFALDNWQPAVDTHKLNNPSCDCVKMNILELDMPEKIDAVVPDTGVIIGSPPCVAFSGSNKAGKADKSLGIKLIEAFLRVIAWKKSKGVLKYWVLENVPNSKDYIKNEYTWKELGLPGKGPKLIVKQRLILNAADFGSPQTRERFFCGDFPKPVETHKGSWVTMADVLDSLTNPLDEKKDTQIRDPVYGFTIPKSKLTDHFYDSRVAEHEWKNAKRMKEDHPVYGRMTFPEDTNRPSRTVMATMSASTREAIIFEAFDDKSKHTGYRMPTIREIATFMAFPITYQFEAGSEGGKYKLVGNAVCCKQATAIAETIMLNEGLNPPKEFIPLPDVRPSKDLTGMKRKNKPEKQKPFNSKFEMHVPYIKINSMRVQLSNKGSDFDKGKIRWRCEIRYGPAKNHKSSIISNELLERLMDSGEKSTLTLKGIFKKFKSEINRTFAGKIPDANVFQENYCKRMRRGSPETVLEKLKIIIDKHYPEKRFSDVRLDNSKRIIGVEHDRVPIRVAAATYGCNFITEETKRQLRKDF